MQLKVYFYLILSFSPKFIFGGYFILWSGVTFNLFRLSKLSWIISPAVFEIFFDIYNNFFITTDFFCESSGSTKSYVAVLLCRGFVSTPLFRGFLSHYSSHPSFSDVFLWRHTWHYRIQWFHLLYSSKCLSVFEKVYET